MNLKKCPNKLKQLLFLSNTSEAQTMIKYTSLLLLLIAFSFSSCKKLNKLTQFDIVYDTDFTIPSSTGINLPTNIITPDFATNSESTLSINDTRKDLIERIILLLISEKQS
jgi:hypothetical protein